MASPLDADNRSALAALVDRDGVNATAGKLRISVTTCARAYAGLPIQVATATHVRTFIAALSSGLPH